MAINRIDVLMPISSQYGALHYFTEKIHEAFLRQGVKSRLINTCDHFKRSAEGYPDLTFGVNGIPQDEDGLYLCERTAVPHLAYLIDPPYRFFDLLRSPQMIIACDDRYSCQALRSMHFDRVFFLPHGVDQLYRGDPSAERPLDAVMLATYIDYERRRALWPERYHQKLCLAMDEAIALTFADNKTSFMEAFQICFNEHLSQGELEGVGVNFVDIFYELELYVKGKSRADLVKSIKSAEITLFNGSVEKGYGWEKELGSRHPNIKLHPPVPYKEGLEFLKQAKFVLNAFIKNKEGAHDRIFNGMAAGACVLSNETLYLEEQFTDEKEILFYKPWQMEALDEKVMQYLNDEQKRVALAFDGQRAVLKAHTWDHRVQTILKELEARLQ